MVLPLNPKNMTDRARYIFNRIFSHAPKAFKELKNINIIVIGAGSFPSFLPLLDKMMNICPEVETINFTLVDPNESAINLFKRDTESLTKNLPAKLKVNFEIYNCDIQYYLKNHTNQIFDLVYFEHPDISILSVLMTKLGFSKETLEISFQESMPLLRNITKPGSLLIASCIFKGDMRQVVSLLRFSLRLKMYIYRQAKVLSDGGDYSYGLIGVIKSSKCYKKTPAALIREIQFSSTSLAIFFVLSFIVFLASPSAIRIISFLFVMAQLFYHRYGVRGTTVRLLLVMAQLMLLFLAN